jgi:hypothetical protein
LVPQRGARERCSILMLGCRNPWAERCRDGRIGAGMRRSAVRVSRPMRCHSGRCCWSCGAGQHRGRDSSGAATPGRAMAACATELAVSAGEAAWARNLLCASADRLGSKSSPHAGGIGAWPRLFPNKRWASTRSREAVARSARAKRKIAVSVERIVTTLGVIRKKRRKHPRIARAWYVASCAASTLFRTNAPS